MTNEDLTENLFNFELSHQHDLSVFVALELFPEDDFVRICKVVAGDLDKKRAYLAWIKKLSLGQPLQRKIREEIMSLRNDLKTGKKILKHTHILSAKAKQPA